MVSFKRRFAPQPFALSVARAAGGVEAPPPPSRICYARKQGDTCSVGASFGAGGKRCSRFGCVRKTQEHREQARSYRERVKPYGRDATGSKRSG
jgi:hypothetical protein